MKNQLIIDKLIKFLKERYGRDIKIKPSTNHEVFKILITTILSQRTRDENTEKAADNLFSKADTPEKILKLRKKELEKLIRISGPYRQKAKRIKEVSKIILEKYNGKVPKTREELLKLPGVGFKTADVVLMYGHGIPSIAIDTHCNRVPKRIGLVDEKANVEEVKRVLEELIPKKDWYIVNMGLVQFGREICRPINPNCENCPMSKYCYYYKNILNRFAKQMV
jgi:endonuclease-3